MEISCLLEEVHSKMSVASATKTYGKKSYGIRLSWAWGHLVEWKEQVFSLGGRSQVLGVILLLFQGVVSVGGARK